MQRRHTPGATAYFCIYCAFFVHISACFNLHVIAYLPLCILNHVTHISWRVYISLLCIFWKCIFLHIWFAYFCIFLHMYAYVIFAYVCIFWIFMNIYAYLELLLVSTYIAYFLFAYLCKFFMFSIVWYCLLLHISFIFLHILICL